VQALSYNILSNSKSKIIAPFLFFRQEKAQSHAGTRGMGDLVFWY
jgi:hypothetical protein